MPDVTSDAERGDIEARFLAALEKTGGTPSSSVAMRGRPSEPWRVGSEWAAKRSV